MPSSNVITLGIESYGEQRVVMPIDHVQIEIRFGIECFIAVRTQPFVGGYSRLVQFLLVEYVVDRRETAFERYGYLMLFIDRTESLGIQRAVERSCMGKNSRVCSNPERCDCLRVNTIYGHERDLRGSRWRAVPHGYSSSCHRACRNI